MGEYNSRGGRYRSRHNRRKENKKLLVFVGAIIGISIVILLGLLIGGNKKDDLVGVWRYDQYTEYEFAEDETGCLCVDDVHYEYIYKIAGDKLKLNFTENVVTDCEYQFEVKGKTLVLIGGEGTDGGTYELKRTQK